MALLVLKGLKIGKGMAKVGAFYGGVQVFNSVKAGTFFDIYCKKEKKKKKIKK